MTDATDHAHARTQMEARAKKLGLQIRRLVREEVKTDLLKIADAGELEDMRREVTNYFKNKQ